MPADSSDAALVRRCLDGDLDAFEELVRRHQLAVWSVVTAMVWNRSQTEDLVQETFLQAYAHLDRYDGREDVVPWLKQIARNLVREQQRRQRRESGHRERLQDIFLRLQEERHAPAGDAEWLEALRHCQERLPDRSRHLIDDYYRRGLSCACIAELVQSTPAAVQKALSRIRCALRDCIRRRVQS